MRCLKGEPRNVRAVSCQDGARSPRAVEATLSRHWYLSPRAYMVTTLRDGGEIWINNFGNTSSPKRLMHIATLHPPLPHDHRLPLGLTTAAGTFLTRHPADVLIAAAHNARAHVFTFHHDPAAHDMAADVFRGAQPDTDSVH